MLIQLPDDVQAKGYKLVRPFHYEQVFYSPSKGFTGTEQEFMAAGLAYRYIQTGKYTRVLTKQR
jgi:hypothetical protein